MVKMIPLTPTHTLPPHQCTKITHFPPGYRLAKLRNTSRYAKRFEVGCQISHCETMRGDEYLNIEQIMANGGLIDLTCRIDGSYINKDKIAGKVFNRAFNKDITC